MHNHTGSLLLQTAFFLAVSSDQPRTNTIDQVRRGIDYGDMCYDEVGCYSINAPWVSETRPVANHPESPEKIDPKFCLYTRQNKNSCQRLFYSSPEGLRNSQLVATHRTYLIAHGFLENGNKKWIHVMAQRLLNRSDANVIVIGWEGGSAPPYTQAVANIRVVGTMGAFLLNAMHKHVGIQLEFTHVIGHSLGAHLAGYIGNTLQTKFGLKLGRISALDPAEPHFSQTDPIVRLDPTDAYFVDVVHTDATPFIKGGLGMDEPIGHLDFYPNGGKNQPGCDNSMQSYIDKEDGSFFKGLRKFLGCNHVRSYEYFIESIPNRCEFLAVECDSWSNFLAGNCFGCKSALNPNGPICSKLGYSSVLTAEEMGASTGNVHHTLNKTLVQLYTITNSKQPYCRALYRATIIMSSSHESKEHGGEIGALSIQIIGIKGKTTFIDFLKEQPFKPGNVYRQVISGTQVGRVRNANIYWKHTMSLNILTWRFAIPKVYLEKIIIDNLEEDSSIELCPEGGEVIVSAKEKNLRPCGENSTSFISSTM